MRPPAYCKKALGREESIQPLHLLGKAESGWLCAGESVMKVQVSLHGQVWPNLPPSVQ